MGSDVLKTNRWFLLCSLAIGVFFAFSLFSTKPVLASTGINQEINFQGRLLNSQGATVPDGYYNIEFKIYQDGDGQSVGDTTGSPSGSLKWTEDYLNNNSQGVKIVNGFLSVQLGSINPFGSSIDWNQSTLWLSMNIGNTNVSCTPFSSCGPDGEMTPMQPLTSAVYALNANELGGVTAASFGQLANNQTWTGTNLVQPTTNITGLEVRQTSASSPTADIFDVQGTGGSADNFIQVTSTAANQGAVSISALGSNAVTLTSGSNQLAINNTASAFTGNVTTTGTINSQTISSAASFTGTLNVATGYQVAGAATTGNYLRGNGTNFVSSAIQVGDIPSGSTYYINNTTSTQNANFYVTAATSGTVAGVLRANASGTGDILDYRDGAGNIVGTVNYTGNVLVEPDTNSNAALLVENQTGKVVLRVDTSANKLTLGNVTSVAGNNEAGNLIIADGTTDNYALTVNIPTLTNNHTIQFPDAGGTVCLQTATACGFAATPVSGSYLEQVPTTTAANTIAPLVGSVVGLTVTGTTGTAATAENIIQGGAAADLTLSNTASTSGNLVSLTQSTSAYTGTALLLNLAAGSGSFSGNFLDLQKNSTSEFKVDNGGNVTATGTIQGTSLNGTTGINTGATGGTQRIDSSGDLVNIGTIATSGGINGQTISSAANFSGTLNVATGYQIAGVAATGNYLRGNGTNFVSSTIQSGDLPNLQGTYIANIPTSTANNTIAPSAANVVGLTVNGTTGTAATAVNIIQGGAAAGLGITSSTTGDGEDISLTNTTGTQTNGIYVNQDGSGGTTTNLLNLTNTLGTVTNAINLSGTFTNLINSTNFNVTNGGALTAVGVNSGSGQLQGSGGLSLTGTANINTSGSAATSIGNSGSTVTIASSGFNVTALGAVSGVTTLSTSSTINSQTISNAASFTGTLAVASSITGGTYNTDTLNSTALTFSGSNPIISASTSNTGITLQANGTGTLLLDSTGAGTVTIGSTATTINVGANTSTADAVGIGSSNTSTALTLQGGASKLIINNTASAFTGNVTTTGTVNSQTISSSASFTGTVNVATGYQVAGAATSGNYLRGNGTNFVSSAIQLSDLPNLQGTYIANVPTSTANNTIAPTAASVVGLTINGTSGTAATATNIIQGGAATGLGITSSNTGDGQDISLTNTAGTQANGIYVNRSGSGGITSNLLNLTNTSGTATNAISLNGTFTNLINSTNFGVTNNGNITAGTYNTDTLNSTALTFSGSNPIISASTSNTGITLQANGTGTLLLDTTGAGTVNVGSSATNVNLGGGTANETVGVGNSSGNDTVNISTNTGTNGINIGTNSSAADTIGIGSSDTGTAITLQGGSSKLVINNTASAFTGNVTTTGTINTDTLTATALTFSGTNPIISASTSNTGLSLQGNGTGILTLNTTGAGTVNLGTTNSTTISIGNTTAATTTLIQGGTSSTALSLQVAGSGTIIIGATGSVGNSTTISVGTSTGAAQAFTAGSTNSGSTSKLVAGATSESLTNTSDTIANSAGSTTAFQVQKTASPSVLDVDTTNSRVGINTTSPAATFEINSTVSGSTGLQFQQVTSSSSGSSSFSGILGVDSSGNVGLTQASVSLTSPALAYWDGLNNPTVTGQSYPLATLSGTATYSGSANGVELTPIANNDSGSVNWSFDQVPFEEIQFQFMAGGGTGADSTWFYSYANATPTTEYGTGTTSGYLIYFSEYHGCAGITYGSYTDGNQCVAGGGTAGDPLDAVTLANIANSTWHNVDIQILDNQIIVRWDGNVIMDYSDVYTRDTSNLNFGFGSRTGGSDNAHYIKGLLVTKLGTNASQYFIDNVSPLASGLYWKNSSTSAGDLGIGTSSPLTTLDVVGDSTFESASNDATAFQIQNSSAQDLFNVDDSTGSAAGGKVSIGSGTTSQTLFQVDQFSTFADTSTCNTANVGSIYFNTSASADNLRLCGDPGGTPTWEDMPSTNGLNALLFGVIPDSGPSPGDLAGVNASDASKGPCHVYMGSANNSVRWTACDVYSNGREQVIPAQTTNYTTAITTTASAYQNLCIFTAGNGPTFGTASTTETSATVPTWSATQPALCLATIKEKSTGSGIGIIYDTRIFTTSTKELTTIATAVGPGFAVKLNGTIGQVTPTSATTDPFYGVVAAWSGTTQTTAINAIVVTAGPVYVQATAGSVGAYIIPTATTGQVNTTAVVTTAQSVIPFNYLGLAQSPYNAPGTQCSTTANADTCRGSIFTVLDIR